jgi:hypothetical protein
MEEIHFADQKLLTLQLRINSWDCKEVAAGGVWRVGAVDVDSSEKEKYKIKKVCLTATGTCTAAISRLYKNL